MDPKYFQLVELKELPEDIFERDETEALHQESSRPISSANVDPPQLLMDPKYYQPVEMTELPEDIFERDETKGLHLENRLPSSSANIEIVGKKQSNSSQDQFDLKIIKTACDGQPSQTVTVPEAAYDRNAVSTTSHIPQPAVHDVGERGNQPHKVNFECVSQPSKPATTSASVVQSIVPEVTVVSLKEYLGSDYAVNFIRETIHRTEDKPPEKSAASESNCGQSSSSNCSPANICGSLDCSSTGPSFTAEDDNEGQLHAVAGSQSSRLPAISEQEERLQLTEDAAQRYRQKKRKEADDSLESGMKTRKKTEM